MQDEAKCRFDAIVRTLNLLFQTYWQFYKTPRTTWCVLSLIGTYTSQVALKWKSSHNKTFISVTLYCYAHCMLFTITFVAKILAIRAEINDMKYCVKELKKKKKPVPFRKWDFWQKGDIICRLVLMWLSIKVCLPYLLESYKTQLYISLFWTTTEYLIAHRHKCIYFFNKGIYSINK